MTLTPTIHGARRRMQTRATVSPDLFRDALAAHPAGVVVVTGHDDEGPVGLTATSFVSISLDPPLVAFAVDITSSTWPRLRQASSLVVHLLGEEHTELAARFASKGIDRFAAPTEWARLKTGEPLLSAAPVWLRGVVDEHIALGDHILVVAQVAEACVDGQSAPLVYHRRAFHSLSLLP